MRGRNTSQDCFIANTLVNPPPATPRTIAKLAREVYKDKVGKRDGRCADYGGEGISVRVLGAGAGPQDGQRGQTSLSSHSASDPAGLGLRSDHHGPHRPLRQDELAGSEGASGFLRDHPPHATTISRTLAGVSHQRLQKALTGWVAHMVADRELNASVDGKWAKQSEDVSGNPLVMVNVLAHDLRLCLAQWPASDKRYEPGVLREQLAPLFERYPGLRLLTMTPSMRSGTCARP